VFEVVSIRSQVVAGTSYFAKVRIGADKYAHLHVFKPLPGNEQEGVQLLSYQLDKELHDPLEYF
jgi:cystatin-A/B